MIGHVASSRPDYFDRNPLAKDLGYSAAGIGPHGSTTRATYTVPAGKKAYLEVIAAHIRRQTAAAPVGLVRALFIYTPFGGSSWYPTLITLATNGVSDAAHGELSGLGLLAAGDLIRLLTEDLSTGGTVEYQGIIKAVEFDA